MTIQYRFRNLLELADHFEQMAGAIRRQVRHQAQTGHLKARNKTIHEVAAAWENAANITRNTTLGDHEPLRSEARCVGCGEPRANCTCEVSDFENK